MNVEMTIPSVPGLPATAALMPSLFDTISRMVKQRCGINLHDGKVALVEARLNKRLRALGLADFAEYVEFLRNDAGGTEIVAMLDALSTNLTHFFREPRHFTILKESIVPEMLARHRANRQLRIWSAGCSSGEEPYSIAITMQEAIPDPAGWDLGILATDLSSPMLRAACEGRYARERLRETPARTIRENFTPVRGRAGEYYRILEPVKSMVHFARLNLMDPWPMKGPFDAIFCRNVMIYFDKDTQRRLIDRFWNILAADGVLFVGHSESLLGFGHRFHYVEPTIYRKLSRAGQERQP